MAQQIIFFEKPASDIGNPGVSATASQGAAYATYALNRSNLSAWITTGSVDADNTTWTLDMTDEKRISEILLIKHNFKSFTVKYWNGSAYQDFSPAINETTNTKAVNRYTVTPQSTSKIQITITGTLTPNSDKYLYQFLATEKLGQFNGWPQIKKPVHSRNRKKNGMLSGRSNIAENVGAFSCELSVKEWKDSTDLTLVERLYNMSEGFLIWPSGGDESQFSSARQGYRLEDIYLVKCADEYEPSFVSGQYQRGLDISISLTEVVD